MHFLCICVLVLFIPCSLLTVLHISFNFGLKALCGEGGRVSASGKSKTPTSHRSEGEEDATVHIWTSVDIICLAGKSQRVWTNISESWAEVFFAVKSLSGSTDLQPQHFCRDVYISPKLSAEKQPLEQQRSGMLIQDVKYLISSPLSPEVWKNLCPVYCKGLYSLLSWYSCEKGLYFSSGAQLKYLSQSPKQLSSISASLYGLYSQRLPLPSVSGTVKTTSPGGWICGSCSNTGSPFQDQGTWLLTTPFLNPAPSFIPHCGSRSYTLAPRAGQSTEQCRTEDKSNPGLFFSCGKPAQLFPKNCRVVFPDTAQDFSEDKLKVTVWSCSAKAL